jgi:hypothetical protein
VQGQGNFWLCLLFSNTTTFTLYPAAAASTVPFSFTQLALNIPPFRHVVRRSSPAGDADLCLHVGQCQICQLAAAAACNTACSNAGPVETAIGQHQQHTRSVRPAVDGLSFLHLTRCPRRFKISARASVEAGLSGPADVPQHTASAVAEDGKGLVPKADGGDRDKKMKRTERLRNLDRELKRSLYAATAQQPHVAAAADDSEAECETGCELPATPACRRRIRISGFSYGLINGIYEETEEEGQGGRRVLQHEDDSDVCLEWLNGGCCAQLCGAAA